MRAIIFLLVVVVTSQNSSACFLPKTLLGRIVNGENAQPGEFPYQVSLQTISSSFHFCGGSILNKDYVITAAHCVVHQYPRIIKIVAATTDLSEPQTTHEVEKITIHEGYHAVDSWRNDIALIKVKTPFIVSSVLDFISLPSPSQEIPVDAIAVVSGWGYLWEGGLFPHILQKTQILIADQEYCQERYNIYGYNIHDTHICAHNPTVETGSCNGDSGGPLTVNGKLVGIVSWSIGCATTDFPTVYTRVPEYLDWIKAHTV